LKPTPLPSEKLHPDKLRQIEIYEIENYLSDKIMTKVYEILTDQDSDDLYCGAFKKDTKPEQGKLAECLIEHGYKPDLYDEKVSNIIAKLSEESEFAFLVNGGAKVYHLARRLKSVPL